MESFIKKVAVKVVAGLVLTAILGPVGTALGAAVDVDVDDFDAGSDE